MYASHYKCFIGTHCCVLLPESHWNILHVVIHYILELAMVIARRRSTLYEFQNNRQESRPTQVSLYHEKCDTITSSFCRISFSGVFSETCKYRNLPMFQMKAATADVCAFARKKNSTLFYNFMAVILHFYQAEAISLQVNSQQSSRNKSD